MCDHHDGRFKAEFPYCMSTIFASRGVRDPHTVTNMIHYRVPFIIGSQSTCDIERDWCFAKKGAAQTFDVWMPRNPSRGAFYCDLTSGYIGDEGVLNEDVFLFFEYYDLTIRDGHMVEDNTVVESVPTLIPDYLDLTV